MEKITKITFYGKDFSPLKDAKYRLAGQEPKTVGTGAERLLLEAFCRSYQDRTAEKIALRFPKNPEFFYKYVGVFREKKFPNPVDNEFYDVTLEISCRFDRDKKAYFLAAMLLCLNPEDLKQIPDRANITFHQVMDIFLLFMYKKQLAEAAKKGIFRKYQRFENNDSRPHGTIDIARHIRENMGLENGKIAYHYRELTANNPVNRLILAAYKRLCEKYPELCENRIKNDERVYPTLKMLQMELGYSKASVRNIVKENLRPVTHPYFSEYEALRKTCLIILRDEGVSIFDAESAEETESLSTDVTKLWEKFLESRLNQLKKLEKYSGLSLKPQDEKPIFAGRNRHNKYAKPDFCIQKGERTAILDAKFKPRWNKFFCESTSGDDWIDADISKCFRDMVVFQAGRTGVIFPAKGPFDDSYKTYRIGTSGDWFDMVRVPVPPTEKSFENWCKILETDVDQVLKVYLNDLLSRT